MYRSIKRIVDIAISGVALVVLSPVILVVASINAKVHGLPIFFSQVRPGLNEKLFRMYKFRTMTNERDAQGQLLPDDVRLTSWGKFLRATSLDELPELWNVLKGDMSVVGPRPLLPEYLEHYTATQKRRHEVRPGITGLAQVQGRNELSWAEKFTFDVAYVEGLSLALDAKIIAKTVLSVLKREGINTVEGVAMPKFGSEE
jgi:lipopolysaccharide/colanic/teichoic acid biosynthesis glycosyltransferase